MSGLDTAEQDASKMSGTPRESRGTSTGCSPGGSPPTIAETAFQSAQSAFKWVSGLFARAPDDPVAEIKRIVQNRTNIVVVWSAISDDNKANVLDQIKRYLDGKLVVWRGVQQCHPSFPDGPSYDHVTPKNSGSEDLPDFSDNNNAWIPFYEDEETCLGVALSWSHRIIKYFNGTMDSSRPVALVLEKRLGPDDMVAFGMYPEVQVKGTTVATVHRRIGIDTDWNELKPAVYKDRGTNFRSFAEEAGLKIT